jgi:hypothetical protein
LISFTITGSRVVCKLRTLSNWCEGFSSAGCTCFFGEITHLLMKSGTTQGSARRDAGIVPGRSECGTRIVHRVEACLHRRCTCGLLEKMTTYYIFRLSSRYAMTNCPVVNHRLEVPSIILNQPTSVDNNDAFGQTRGRAARHTFIKEDRKLRSITRC